MTCAQSQAEFFARVTASATHEVRNVLAIVRESAGLVDDLIVLASGDGRPDRERVGRALGRIDAQVRRGSDLMTSLSRVAHGLDREEERLELDAAVRDVVRLCERAARERGRELVVLDAEGAPAVTSCALVVYMALTRAMEWCLEQVPAGCGLKVRAGSVEGRPSVRFEALEGAVPCPAFEEDEWDRLVEELADLAGVPERGGSGRSLSVVFG